MDATGVAVVTGASRGIGRAVARELAARGFDTVATMRDVSAGEDLPMRVERLDVTDPSSIRLPDGLRVLVNNAGVERPHHPFEATPADDWRAMFETNVFGLIEVTKRAIPLMRASGGGVICNVTSSSLFAPVPFYSPYRASKAAVSALGESLRTELAPFGIRLVEIMPGPIETDMLAGSEEPPAALDHEAYRPMAQRSHDLRGNVKGSYTPVAEAAVAIVDAICDDDGPLRYGCDPMSVGLLEMWRTTPDEDLMTMMSQGWLGSWS
ncbi:MAG: family NAD(P)-dependent oxidoreductase [Acidimicrobiales bacterium]|nr:family NAD(P)-dependent oxidoreductase [Acidimicrobiales bacterium]